MASKSSHSLWKKSISICESWLEFAPAERLQAFEKSKDPKQWNIESIQDGFIGRAMDFVAQAGSFKRQKDQLETEFKTAIEAGIMRGDYVAFGFRKLPSRGSKPVRIDIENCLSIEIDWDLGELSTHERTYDRTCIMPISEMEQLLKQNEAKPASNAILRIRTAIDELAQTQKGFRDLTRDLHIADHGRDDATVAICANCHRKVTDDQKDHPTFDQCTDPTLDRIGHFLIGLADLLSLIVEKLLEFAHILIELAQPQAIEGDAQ